MASSGQTKQPLASWLPFAAAIAVPLVLLTVMGLFSFDQSRREAELRVQRSIEALTEHALRTFRAHDLIITAVDKHMEDWTWDQIKGSAALHDFFKSLIRNADDINTIFVVATNGDGGNSSLLFPLTTDMRSRPFYRELRQQGGLHISEPDVGRINKQRYFSFTRRRSSADGSFNGVISVSVNPDYFARFYRSTMEGPEDAVALIRADGLMLVRAPTQGPLERVMLTVSSGGLMNAIRTNPVGGSFTQVATVDGVKRLYAYRRIGEYPLYVSYGLSYSNLWGAWRRTMLAYSLVSLAAIGLLLGAAALVRVHTRREAEATRRYAEESARRMAAEQTSRSKDEFLAALSHELRNPLSSISAGVEILRRSTALDLNGTRAVDIIGRQIEHLRRLLSDLLDVARSVYGKMNIEPERLSMLDVASIVTGSYPAILQQQVKLTIGGARGFVMADRTRLRQMIENLVDNAYKYGARNIAITVGEDGSHTKLVVSDDGDGISPELMPTLFEPFVQGKQALDRAQGGLGLGLALVQRLAVAHGGSLEGRSDGAGKGSTFTISLPRAAALAGDTAAPVAAAIPRSRRVLVVEDQLDARESLSMLLELDGHAVETASDGRDGVARYLSFAPEVVLIDIGLPGMNGYQVAREIRARQGSRRPCLVALTGYGQAEDQKLAVDAGFDHHMTKPVSYDDLVKLLARIG